MYGYEYEEDILLYLRVLKYLHLNDPKSFELILGEFQNIPADAGTDYHIYDFITDAMLNAIHYCLFPQSESLIDEDWEVEIWCISHPILDRFWALSCEWYDDRGYCYSAIEKRFQDLVMYIATATSDAICDLSYNFSRFGVEIGVYLSPYQCDLVQLGNSLLDLLLYVQTETEQLELLIEMEDKIIPIAPDNYREEAA